MLYVYSCNCRHHLRFFFLSLLTNQLYNLYPVTTIPPCHLSLSCTISFRFSTDSLQFRPSYFFPCRGRLPRGKTFFDGSSLYRNYDLTIGGFVDLRRKQFTVPIPFTIFDSRSSFASSSSYVCVDTALQILPRILLSSNGFSVSVVIVHVSSCLRVHMPSAGLVITV